jgi:hypothetical protein
MISDKRLPLNDCLNLYSSREKSIDWLQVSEHMKSKPRQINKLTLFYAVMVGAKNEQGQLDFPGTDDSNPLPLEMVEHILKFSAGAIEVSSYNTLLLYALLNNNVTTEVFQHIIDTYRRWCPEKNLISQCLQSYSTISEGRTWSPCRTNPRRKLWLLW